MASKFNLTAQLSLAAPTNIPQIVTAVNRQLQGVQMNINPVVNTKALSQANQAIQNVGVSAKVTSKNLNTAAGSANSLGSALGAAARRFASITLATGFFLALTRALGSAVGRAVEFEKEMLKISQVTGKSISALKDLSSEVTRLSGNLGVSSEELLSAARTLSQAGFAAEKVTGALKVLAQTDLAATFDNIKDTTEGAIAILSQFRKEVRAAGGEVQFLEMAMDSINAVSKSFAVESADLISVVRRTGGVFEAAGGKLNELIALFTSVRATTRETADTIATGFRTIFTRIQRSETIDSLRELGIVLQDTEGKFVGPMEAIARLSAGLKALDPRDFRFNEIVEQLGGFRQIGKVIPLIKQYQTSTEALAVANNSLGSTAKDAGIAQQGLGNQFAQLKEKFDATVRSLADSDTFQTLATSAIKMAEAILRIVDALEPLLPMLTALAAFKLGQIAVPAFGKFAGIGANAGGKIQGFAGGGMVPGRGNRDTVPAVLTPGEFVMRKSAVKKIGANNMAEMNNGYAAGGTVTARRSNYGNGFKPNKKAFDKALTPEQKALAQRQMTGSGKSKADAALLTKPVEFLATRHIGGFSTIGGKEAGGYESYTLGGYGPENGFYLKPSDLNTSQRAMIAKNRGLKPQELNKVTQFPANLSGSFSTYTPSLAALKNGPYTSLLATGAEAGLEAAFDRAAGMLPDLSLPPALRVDSENIDMARASSINDDNARKSLEGFLGEGMLAAVSGAIPAQGGASFDLPAGSMDNSRKNLMAIYGGTAGALVKAEVKRSKNNLTSKEKGLPKKTANDIMDGRMEGVIPKYAKGGQVDTVPAMLTPGEFVMKKSAAQGIGYANLHRMNQSNGVNGYAAGGIVTGTRGSYGNGVPGGAGGGSIGTIPGIESASKGFTQLAKSIGNLVGQLIRAGEAITLGANSASEKLVQGATTLGGELSATGNRFISLPGTILNLLDDGAVQFSAAIADASKGISTVDNLLREAINGSLTQFRAAMADASKGISTVDNIMNTTMTGAMAPLKGSLTLLDGEFKKFGKELTLKLKYFDVLKKANTDLVTVMEKLGQALMEKADDFNILKPPLTQVEASLVGLSAVIRAQDQLFIPLRSAVYKLSAAMQGQATQMAGKGGGMSMLAISGPMQQIALAMGQAAKALMSMPQFIGQLNGAMVRMVEALNLSGQQLTQLGGTTGGSSKEMAELMARIDMLEKRIIELENAAKGATGKLNATKTPAGGAAAGGGGMMAGAGNNVMMAGMMAGMMVQSMDGVSESFKALITDITMVGMVFGMIAMSMQNMLAGLISKAAMWVAAKASETVASTMSAAADTGETIASGASAAADAAEAIASMAAAGASAIAAGALIGVAVGATLVYVRFQVLTRQAKALTAAFTDGMKDMQQGMQGKSLAEYQSDIGKALQKEAEASSSALWGAVVGITYAIVAVVAVVVAFGVAIASLAAAPFTLGASLTGLAAVTALLAVAITGATAAGMAIGEAVATVEQGLEASTMALSASAFYASKALGDLGNANKEMAFEMLEGSGLLARQSAAILQFSGGLNAANTQMAMFKSIDAGMDREIRDDMLDSDVFSEIKDLGEDAMKALAKTAYESAKTLQGSLNATMAEFQESGQSFTDAMSTQEIQTGLAAYSMSVRDATALNLMQNGTMRVLAQQQLGLAGATEDAMTSGERAAILAREQSLIQAKATETAQKARAAQEKAMKDAADAADKAAKAAAQKLAADQEMARSAFKAAMALNEFGNALLGLEQTSAIVNVAFGRLTGTITQFKNDTEQQIAALKSGDVSTESAAAARTVGAEFGIESQVEKVLSSVQETERIRKVLTIKGLKEFSGTLTESAANLRFNDFLKNNNIDLSGLSKDVRGEILGMLEDGLQPGEIEKIIGFVNDANKGQIEMLQKLAKARNNYLNHLFKFGAAVAKADKKFRDAIVRMTKVAQTAADRMAKATGRDVTVREVAGNERALRDANLGLGMRAGGPAEVGQQISNRSDQISAIDDMISSLAETAGNDEQIIKLQNEQRKLAGESKQLTDNLKALSNQAKLAAAIMSEIDKEKGKRDTIRGLISEFTFASNQGRKDMDRNFMALQRVMATGNLNSIPDEMRSAVGGLLDTLKDIAIGPGGQTGGEIKKVLEMQMANQLKIRATGKPLTAEEMEKIFTRTTKEEQLINDLRALGAEEQQAAMALAQQDHDAMRDLIGSIGELVRVLQNAQVVAGQDAGAAVNATLSRGGWVRFDEGGGATSAQAGAPTTAFAPQGTDTVPAMLTPGEFVVNRKAAQRNAGALQSINSGKVQYLAGGGFAGGTLDEYKNSALLMQGNLTYQNVIGSAQTAGKQVALKETDKLNQLNESTKEGLPGSMVLDHLRNAVGGDAMRHLSGIGDKVFPVFMGGGGAWKGKGRVDQNNQTLHMAQLGNDVTELAKSYISLKNWNPVGNSRQKMGSSSQGTADKVKEAIMRWQYNMGYYWGINGTPGWKKDDKGGFSFFGSTWTGSDDLPEWLKDIAANQGDAIPTWIEWEKYPKSPTRVPLVAGAQFWDKYKQGFLNQGSSADRYNDPWWSAAEAQPQFSTYDVSDINEGEGDTEGSMFADIGFSPNPPYKKDAPNVKASWTPGGANFPGSLGSGAGFYAAGGKQVSWDNLGGMADAAKKMSEQNWQPDTMPGGDFESYGSLKTELLKSAYGGYAFDLEATMKQNMEVIQAYLAGTRGWHNADDPDGTGIRAGAMNWSPKQWLANTQAGQKAKEIVDMVRESSAQEALDRETIRRNQIQDPSTNWDKIFGGQAGSLGMTDGYFLNVPEYGAIRAAGEALVFGKGGDLFTQLAALPEVSPAYSKVDQIDDVAALFDQLSDTFGLGKNFKNQLKVAQEQAAEAQAEQAAEGLQEKKDFIEENRRLNANMDFGLFNNRAGFMEEARTKMKDDKIFRRTPRYAFKLGVPTSATRLHKIPPTAKNFNALFPFSMLLAEDLQTMTKGNLLSSLDGKGIKYNVGRIMGALGNVVDDGFGNPTFEGAGAGAGRNLNNIIQTVEGGAWKRLVFNGNRQFFGPPGPSKESGLVGTYGSMPYPSWYSGMFKGYKGLSEEEVDVSSFYFKDAIAAGGLPKQIAGETQDLWKAIMAKWNAGVQAIRGAGAGPGGMNAQAAGNFATGGPVGINWKPKGTDTVPAMLTPGEFVMKKSAVDKHGMGFMTAINEGRGTSGRYKHAGGGVASGNPSQFGAQEDLRIDRVLSNTQTTSKAVNEIAGMITKVDSKTNNQGDLLNSFNTMSEADSALSAQIQSGLSSIFDQRVDLPEDLGEGIVDDMETEFLNQLGNLRQLLSGDHQFIKGQNVFLRGQSFTNFSRLANAMGNGGHFMGPPPQFMATGGMARGTDTVPAMLTPGEFVMKKSVVDKYGVGFMRSLNNGASPTSRSRGVQYLHDGGSAVGGGGDFFAGVGDIVSSISDSLSAFTQAFSLFSGLSSMLSNTINSMADMSITHNININGSLAIPGFSQEDIDGIIANISNGVTRGVDEKIKQAFAQRDLDEENKM